VGMMRLGSTQRIVIQEETLCVRLFKKKKGVNPFEMFEGRLVIQEKRE
jgi:hypothetical protein